MILYDTQRNRHRLSRRRRCQVAPLCRFDLELTDYIMADPRARTELMFSWLYEQYCWIMGFCRQLPEAPTASPEEARQAALKDYESVFCSLMARLQVRKRHQPSSKSSDLVFTKSILAPTHWWPLQVVTCSLIVSQSFYLVNLVLSNYCLLEPLCFYFLLGQYPSMCSIRSRRTSLH